MSYLSEWLKSTTEQQELVQMWRKRNTRALLVGMQAGTATCGEYQVISIFLRNHHPVFHSSLTIAQLPVAKTKNSDFSTPLPIFTISHFSCNSHSTESEVIAHLF